MTSEQQTPQNNNGILFSKGSVEKLLSYYWLTFAIHMEYTLIFYIYIDLADFGRHKIWNFDNLGRGGGFQKKKQYFCWV